jgi:alkylation response protein AidB-like acyl-CoA dehydrogenase
VISLSNTLFVPGLSKGLISASQLMKKGCKVTFSGQEAQITKNNEVYLKAIESDGLYKIETAVAANLVTRNAGKTIQEWHRILGHLNYDAIKRLPKHVDDMKISKLSHGECDLTQDYRSMKK